MPKWAKNILCAFVLILLIARWRDAATWVGNLVGGIRMPFDNDLFRFNDPVFRLTVFGILVVMVVALWKIYWMHRSDRRK